MAPCNEREDVGSGRLIERRALLLQLPECGLAAGAARPCLLHGRSKAACRIEQTKKFTRHPADQGISDAPQPIAVSQSVNAAIQACI